MINEFLQLLVEEKGLEKREKEGCSTKTEGVKTAMFV